MNRIERSMWAEELRAWTEIFLVGASVCIIILSLIPGVLS